MTEFLDSELFKWVVLPLLIFIARMCDVTLGTLRNVFISKGLRRIVPFIGFFEVLIWLISIRQIMKYLDNPMCYVAFAGGFSMGTYVGLLIERRLALGKQVLRIITERDSRSLIKALRDHNFGVTTIDGHGAKGPVKIILTIVKRTDVDAGLKLIQQHCPQAFYSIEDTRSARQGVFPAATEKARTMDYVKRIFTLTPQK
jgi:uncharacterized protein YebE (UPF0316 family)